MFDLNDLDFLEESLQRMEDLKSQLSDKASYAEALRYTARSLRASSERLISDCGRVRESLQRQ